WGRGQPDDIGAINLGDEKYDPDTDKKPRAGQILWIRGLTRLQTQVIGGELQERLIPVPYSKSSTDQARTLLCGRDPCSERVPPGPGLALRRAQQHESRRGAEEAVVAEQAAVPAEQPRLRRQSAGRADHTGDRRRAIVQSQSHRDGCI
ncbi:unnamed protein product, partial [Trichogramma brassicae]